MRHLRITAHEKDRGSGKDQETDAQAKDARRKVSRGNGDAYAEDDDTRVIVIIIKTLLGSYSPLEIVCREKEKEQSFRKGVRGPKSPQAERQGCQATPSDDRVADQIAEHAHGT